MRSVVEIICSKSVNLFSFRVSASGHQGTLGATVISAGLSEWQALGIELCLSFILTLVYLTTMDDHRRTLPASIGPGPLTYGLAYAACSSMAVSFDINFFVESNITKQQIFGACDRT